MLRVVDNAADVAEHGRLGQAGRKHRQPDTPADKPVSHWNLLKDGLGAERARLRLRRPQPRLEAAVQEGWCSRLEERLTPRGAERKRGRATVWLIRAADQSADRVVTPRPARDSEKANKCRLDPPPGARARVPWGRTRALSPAQPSSDSSRASNTRPKRSRNRPARLPEDPLRRPPDRDRRWPAGAAQLASAVSCFAF